MMRRYFASGRVQGVGFRHHTRREALRIGLTGWVRNLPDGRVEAVAAGSADQLETFERFLRRGPPGASVTSLQALDVSDEMEPAPAFEIR
jgi:acylphosphatase